MANSITSNDTEIFMSFVGREGMFLNTHGYGPYEKMGIAKAKGRADINGRMVNIHPYYFVVKQLKPFVDDNGELGVRWDIVFDSREDKK